MKSSFSSFRFGQALISAAVAFCFSAGAQTLTVTNGLQLWLKADSGVTTNAAGNVTTWADQSGHNNDAVQTDEAAAPILAANAITNKPAVRFDGNDDYLDVASSESVAIVGDIASFFVVKFDDFTNFRSVWGKTAVNLPGPTDYYIVQGTGIPRLYRGAGAQPNLASVDGSVVIRAGNYLVLGFQMAGTTATHYLNGQAVGSGQITVEIGDSGTPLKIGSRDDLFTKMKGDIAELVIYDRALTTAELASLTTYLQNKYGIANAPPTVTITAPANNASVTVPSVVTVSATAADTDGLISKVDFFANGALVGTATATPYRVRVEVQTPGTVTFSAVATDNKDGTGRSSNVVITATGTVSGSLTNTNGVQLWLRADAGITPDAGGAVSTWKDQSGMGNDALQPTADLAPILVDNAVNGKPAVRFDGVDDYLDVASSPSVAITGDIASFFVVRFDDYATFRAVWGKTAANVPRPNDYYLLPNSGIPRVYRGSDDPPANVSTDGRAVPVATYVLLGFSQEGQIMSHFLNGPATASAPLIVTPTDSGTPLKIGSRDDLFTKMKGDIAELLIYNKAVSGADLIALNTYLGSKYGITIVQPTNTRPNVTITAPAAGTVINAPSNLTVSVSATDSDGSIVKVDFFANGGLVGTVARTPFRTTFLVPTSGPLTLRAVATDNLGATSSTELSISSTNQTPSPLPVTTGLALWLRGDAGVGLSGSAVTSWVDYSGNFNTAFQADANLAPELVSNGLGGHPTLRFDGVNDYLEVNHAPSLAITGDITSLFVVKFDDFAAFRTVWAKTAGNLPRPNDYYLPPNDPRPNLLRGGVGLGNVQATEPFPEATFLIGGFETLGTTASHYLGTSPIGSGEITATPLDTGSPLRIGTRGDLFTKLKGELAELLIYSGGLSDTDRDRVVAYLQAKYFTATPTGPRIEVRPQGGNLMLEWTAAGAVLEEAPDITGPWTPVTPAASPFQVTPSAQRKFYRLKL